jgi:hypothetical protein
MIPTEAFESNDEAQVNRFIEYVSCVSPYLGHLEDFTALLPNDGPKRNPRLRPITKEQLPSSQNNKPCPCGSDLKYKKCCKKQ